MFLGCSRRSIDLGKLVAVGSLVKSASVGLQVTQRNGNDLGGKA